MAGKKRSIQFLLSLWIIIFCCFDISKKTTIFRGKDRDANMHEVKVSHFNEITSL